MSLIKSSLRCFFVILSIIGYSSTNVYCLDVVSEFHQQALKRGWLLGHFGSKTATILNVGNSPVNSLRRRTKNWFYASASDSAGGCSAFAVTSDPADLSKAANFTVFSLLANGITNVLERQFGTVKGLAPSSRCEELAVDGVASEIEGKGTKAGLFYFDLRVKPPIAKSIATLDDSRFYMLGPSGSSFPSSWSPDGSGLAYEKGRAIYIYEVLEGKSRFLISGRRPSWSPDGKWIGFQGLDGMAMLFEIQTGKSKALVKGEKCLWSVTWTPDSQFAIFTQYSGDKTVFKICRMRDRAVESLYWSEERFLESRFIWIERSMLTHLLESGEAVAAHR